MENGNFKKKLTKSDHNYELLMMVLENNAILRTLLPAQSELLSRGKTGIKDAKRNERILKAMQGSVNEHIENFMQYVEDKEKE